MTAKLCRRCEEMKSGHEIEPSVSAVYCTKASIEMEYNPANCPKKSKQIMGSKTLHTYTAGLQVNTIVP